MFVIWIAASGKRRSLRSNVQTDLPVSLFSEPSGGRKNGSYYLERFLLGGRCVAGRAEHQQIVGIINELFDAMEKKSTQQVIKPILDRLVKYTFEHFKREEEAMAGVEYPDLIEHKALHNKIRQKTLDFNDNADFVTGHNLLNFLKQWWLGHIQSEDREIRALLGGVCWQQPLGRAGFAAQGIIQARLAEIARHGRT